MARPDTCKRDGGGGRRGKTEWRRGEERGEGEGEKIEGKEREEVEGGKGGKGGKGGRGGSAGRGRWERGHKASHSNTVPQSIT